MTMRMSSTPLKCNSPPKWRELAPPYAQDAFACGQAADLKAAFDALAALDGLNEAAMKLAFDLPLPDTWIPGCDLLKSM
jgi:hypothetical protein